MEHRPSYMKSIHNSMSCKSTFGILLCRNVSTITFLYSVMSLESYLRIKQFVQQCLPFLLTLDCELFTRQANISLSYILRIAALLEIVFNNGSVEIFAHS
jgi:hypothetical protein